jgi:hypothetical protein
MRIFSAIRPAGYHSRSLCRRYPAVESACFQFSGDYYEPNLAAIVNFLISGAYLLPGYPRCYHIEADLINIPVGFSATTLHKFLNETGFGNELLQKTPTYLKPCSE